MKEIAELITKLTEIQIKEIADTWQAAKEIMEQRNQPAKKRGPLRPSGSEASEARR